MFSRERERLCCIGISYACSRIRRTLMTLKRIAKSTPPDFISDGWPLHWDTTAVQIAPALLVSLSFLSLRLCTVLLKMLATPVLFVCLFNTTVPQCLTTVAVATSAYHETMDEDFNHWIGCSKRFIWSLIVSWCQFSGEQICSEESLEWDEGQLFNSTSDIGLIQRHTNTQCSTSTTW